VAQSDVDPVGVRPFTQRVEIAWGRTLRFYEHRIQLLRSLEDARLLKGFRVGVQDVGGRIKSANQELEASPVRLELVALSPDADTDALLTAAGLAIEVVQPPGVHSIRVLLQYLESLPADYDKARASSGKALLSHAAPSIPVKDWAVIVDEEPRDELSCQYEFGIVERAEIPGRLSRQVGRMRGRDQAPPPEERWSTDELPAVAFFLDGIWRWTGRLKGSDALVTIQRLWEDARSQGSAVVGELIMNLELQAEMNEGGAE
jgi:hypothetical protein